MIECFGQSRLQGQLLQQEMNPHSDFIEHTHHYSAVNLDYEHRRGTDLSTWQEVGGHN